MDEKIGIEHIETVIGGICGFGVDLEASLADGKFNIPGDLLRFIGDVMKIPAMVKALPFIPVEFLDIDATENEIIAADIREKLHLPQADVTEVVVCATAAMLSTSDTVKKVMALVAAIKALKHPEA